MTQPPSEKVPVKPVVGVPGQQPQANFTVFAKKSRAQILVLFADRIHKAAVFTVTLLTDDLPLVDPGVSLLHPPGALGGDDEPGKIPLCFHSFALFFTEFSSVYHKKRKMKSPDLRSTLVFFSALGYNSREIRHSVENLKAMYHSPYAVTAKSPEKN